MIEKMTIHKAARSALATAFLFAAPAAAKPVVEPEMPELVIPASTDCYGIGQSVAAQQGGTLAKAVPKTEGGQVVCVIVVLLPGKDGARPRRKQIIVRQ